MTPSALRALAPVPGLTFGTARRGERGPVFAAEDDAVRRATPGRRAEFLAGRAAAHRALRALGQAGQAIPSGPDRAPIWPSGFVGSITHAGDLAIAAVARSGDALSLGIDLEPARPLDKALHEEILRPEERGVTPVDAMRIFSAKEAVYKALYPLTRSLFGFHGLSVSLESGKARLVDHPETRTVMARIALRECSFSQSVSGGLIVTLCHLAPSESEACPESRATVS